MKISKKTLEISAWVFFILGILIITSLMNADYNNRQNEEITEKIQKMAEENKDVDEQTKKDIEFSIRMSRMK